MALLLDAFESLYTGQVYKHRISTHGDRIAGFLYDDLLALGRSPKLVHRITNGEAVVNNMNRVTGQPGRRPDGTFGVLVPGTKGVTRPPYVVLRGPIAQLQIGAEVKIFATKMIAQVDRVLCDLWRQSHILGQQNQSATRVAIVAVNHALEYTGWEGARFTDAKVAPSRDAAEIIRRVHVEIAPLYRELLVLPYVATNRPPYRFSWVDRNRTLQEYNSILVRVSDEYEMRF
jgi:hypothetical protein